MARSLLFGIPLVLLGCGSAVQPVLVEPRAADDRGPSSPPAATERQSESVGKLDWSALILAAAAEYRQYTRVSDQADWAPFLCRGPSPAVLASAAPEQSPHGHKLYFMYASNSDEYLRHPFQREGATASIGQSLVKETYHPTEVSPGQSGPPGRTVTRGGVQYTTGEQGDLFIMTKLDPQTPGTDQGWIYGVTDPRGQNVLAAGRIESCMSCHTRSPRDRLFGLKAAWRE